jgi:hypothetical protein
MFDMAAVTRSQVLPEGLSHADLTRAAEEAAKQVVLGTSEHITSNALLSTLCDRKVASRQMGEFRVNCPTYICDETGRPNGFDPKGTLSMNCRCGTEPCMLRCFRPHLGMHLTK